MGKVFKAIIKVINKTMAIVKIGDKNIDRADAIHKAKSQVTEHQTGKIGDASIQIDDQKETNLGILNGNTEEEIRFSNSNKRLINVTTRYPMVAKKIRHLRTQILQIHPWQYIKDALSRNKQFYYQKKIKIEKIFKARTKVIKETMAIVKTGDKKLDRDDAIHTAQSQVTEPQTGKINDASIQIDDQKETNQNILNGNKEEETKFLNWNERLIEVTTKYPMVAEGIRHLRTKILHPQNKKITRSILVTSASPGEGKSFLCANLGLSLAQGIGKHAIMVDCDLRRPSLAAMFKISNETGLVTHLTSDVDLSLLIKKTGQDKLSLLPSGPPPANPAEIIDSEIMVSLLSELKQRYDDRFIILDSPPMRGAAETTALTNSVDGVILVVRWGHSDRDHVKELVDAIGRDKIIGVVFNAFEVNAIEKVLQKIWGFESN